jgi:hypothetical protein
MGPKDGQIMKNVIIWKTNEEDEGKYELNL